MNTRRTSLLAGLAFGFLAAFGVARAQAPPASPHGSLRVDCAQCHVAESWKAKPERRAFQHGETGWPLRAAHASADCRSCHLSLVFARVGTACADCHRDPHQARLGADCQRCHEPQTWTNQRDQAAQHARTRFPLLGVHARLDCTACHRVTPEAGAVGVPVAGPARTAASGAAFAGTPADCASCHLGDYRSARNPDHARAGFSRNCQTCHLASASAWVGGSASGFAHPATFPLTGAHRSTACASCHTGGTFAGTPRDCVACHRADYDRTTNPNHRSAGFPTSCAQCHTTTQWPGATLSAENHPATFPLTGAHLRTSCTACHVNGRFAGTPRDCIACHQADYDRTSNPNHRAAGFPVDCASCHTTTTFRGATFDHDRFFPINSGKHRGVWSSCQTCHTNPSSFRVFDCLSCHRRGEMDDEHRRVSGYSYASPACYSCHPRGSK